jgi:hypothetical protein
MAGYYFSENSKRALASCHPDLQRLFNEIIKHRDCIIIEGHRGQAEQNRLFELDRSTLRWPDSKHNVSPSQAVDVMPYNPTKPHIRWDDTEQIREFAGFVFGVASQLGINLRWGGHWTRFKDMPHWELSKDPS